MLFMWSMQHWLEHYLLCYQHVKNYIASITIHLLCIDSWFYQPIMLCMYTGIVQEMLPIASVEMDGGIMRFAIDFPDALLTDLVVGASVSVNGTCFTVTSIEGSTVYFDAISETLRITNIGELESGTLVNIERSAAAGAEIGGHILSGHVVDTAKILDIETKERNCRMTFLGDPDWMRYVFNKGYLAINGCSLTVADIDVEGACFSVNLIPETLRVTNFSLLAVGDRVNIEIDQQTQAIVDTVERTLERQRAG